MQRSIGGEMVVGVARYNVVMKIRFSLVLSALALASFALAQTGEAPRSVHKSQAEAASKTAAFSTVPAGDGSVAKALKATDLAEAKAMVGKSGAFTGKITKVFAPKSNGVVILNFANDFKTALTAVVMGQNFSAFPDLTTLKGKTVLITGKFEMYKGSLEVVLKSPDQLKLIK